MRDDSAAIDSDNSDSDVLCVFSGPVRELCAV